MRKKDILKIIEKSKKYDIEKYDEFKIILEFLQCFENNFMEVLNTYENSNVRFCDYYEENVNIDKLMSYFKDNYTGKDKSEQYNYYILYSIFKKCMFFIESLEIFEPEEILESFFMDIEDIRYLIEQFSILNINCEKQTTEFDLGFDNHKYKLLFSGFSLHDVELLDKKTIKALVNKINNILLELNIVPLAEGVDHVRDKFNIPMLRIQLADDFRITFIRKNGFTIILGIELKTGKDINYTRYDSIAKKIESIYLKCELLNSGNLSKEDIHYKVLEEIKNKLEVNQKQSSF